MLAAKSKKYKKLPPNLVFSNNGDIQDDFKCSKWALYRGSGSAIHAAMAGCRPIYVSLDESITLDPLYEVRSGRKKVKKISELRTILHEDLLLSEKSFFGKLENLFSYCKEYFMPFDLEVVLKQLNKDHGEQDDDLL